MSIHISSLNFDLKLFFKTFWGNDTVSKKINKHFFSFLFVQQQDFAAWIRRYKFQQCIGIWLKDQAVEKFKEKTH